MKNAVKYIFLFLGLLYTNTLLAQEQARPQVEMAEVLHQNGKIYLVVLVLLTIFAGVLFILIRIERKLNHLEKERK